MSNQEKITIPELLFEKRHIFIYEPISMKLATNITLQLFELASRSDEPIFLHISSPGGEVYSGLSIIDTIKGINAPVYTYATGLCASMASIIFAVGDKRIMGENARYMIHQPLGGVCGKVSDMETNIAEILYLKKQTAEILSSNSNGKTSVDKVLQMIEKDFYLSAHECLELGFCDEISFKSSKKD